MTKVETQARTNYRERYEQWLHYQGLEEELLQELNSISGQPQEIEERFYKDLEFGTGGMRGIMGAGTNRLNVYTVRKAALALAGYIKQQGQEAMQMGVVIAYDTRQHSTLFAEAAADVLTSQSINVFLFAVIAPTPLLSYAVRYYQAYAGIMLTASHNPPQYHGLKVYNRLGAQMTEETAQLILQEMEKVGNPLAISLSPGQREANRKVYVGKEVREAYMDEIRHLLHQPDLIEAHGDQISLVYTPLHGTGLQPVTNMLQRAGFQHVHVVAQQTLPDPSFSTVTSPNPEEMAAFQLAMELALQVNADLVMATDPDADRIGVLVKDGDEYHKLTGNQLGVLLLHYVLERRQEKGALPTNGAIVKTIVSTDLASKIAETYGVATEQTLTGFKYIAEKIAGYETDGTRSFLFGFEESYGYLLGDFVRDKDAVQTAVIVAEMGLYYKLQHKSLLQVLEEIYQQHGYYHEDLVSLTLKGIEGLQEMKQMMSALRAQPPQAVANLPVEVLEDYQTGLRVRKDGSSERLSLPQSDVCKLILADGSWIAVRPSGTEPKMKIYVASKAATRDEAEMKTAALKASFLQFLGVQR